MTDLDRLTRDQLPEPAATLAAVLDEWRLREHGITSGNHGVGLLLDLLHAAGLVVVPAADVRAVLDWSADSLGDLADAWDRLRAALNTTTTEETP